MAHNPLYTSGQLRDCRIKSGNDDRGDIAWIYLVNAALLGDPIGARVPSRHLLRRRRPRAQTRGSDTLT